MRYCFGAIFFPQRIAFFRIHALGHHDTTITLRYTHGIPDKFAGRSKGKVAHIDRFKLPGFFSGSMFEFAGFSFFLAGDDHRLHAFIFSFCEECDLFFSEDFCGILDFTGSGYEVIRRYGDGHIKIAKSYRKLALSQKLFVLPAFNIVVHTHAWIKLSYRIDIVFVFLHIFIT